jgi:hypothetical protein
MADVVTTLSKLNGLTKQKFASKILDHIPPGIKFSSRLDFGEAMLLGKKYSQPVELVLPQGMTYAAPGAGAFDIEDAEAGVMEEALVDGNQFLFTDLLDYESAAKAQKGGDGAYENAIKRVIKRMMKAATKRIELSALYGGTSLAKVLTVASAGAIVNIDPKAWASGIWLGMKNAKLDVYTDVGGLPGVKINTVGPVKVSRVVVSSKRLHLTGDAADLAAIAATHLLVFHKTVGNEPKGLDRIITNTGDLFDIDATEYELWEGNSYDVAGELTLKKLYRGMSDAIGKGLEEDVQVFLNPEAYGNLIAIEAGLRRHVEASGAGDAKNGFRGVKWEGQHGAIEFVPYINIKQGEAFVFPIGTYKKVGSTDLTMQAPGRKEHEYFRDMEKKAGYELRMYANLGFFCEAPALGTKLTGIVTP